MAKRRHDDAHFPLGGKGHAARRIPTARPVPLLPEPRCADCKFARPLGAELMCQGLDSYLFGGLVDAANNCGAFQRRENDVVR